MRYNLLSVLALAVATRAGAQDAPPIAKYVPPAPDPRHVFVMDSAHILSPAAITALQDSTKALQTATGADIAWVTLPTLGGRAIEDATVYLGRTWKVGSAGNAGDPLRNRGLVILYVPDKSKTAGSNFRVEVGKGLQGTIIDSRSRAISAAMRDDLRAKRYDAGYAKGWAVAASMVREDFASQRAGVAPRSAQPAPKPVRVRGTVTERIVAGIGWAVKVFFAFYGGLVLLVILVVLTFGKRVRGTGVVMAGAGRSDWSGGSDSSDSSDSSSSSDSGGDFGGGGGFDGGGSSDSI